VRRGEWSFGLDDEAMVPYIRFRGVELGGRVLALLGLGAVARAVARRALAFGMVVRAYDPYVDDAALAACGVERAASLEELLRGADVLSVHVERTAETVGMLGAAQLGLLPPGAVVVNTARAQVVDQDALVALLESGHLGGVALDVFAPEPVPPSHPLLAHPRALILPHIGGATDDVVRHHSRMIREDMERLARGERPQHCANPDVLDAVAKP
jgi:phosphoglycerate dehydrogenase-like enzyme